MLFLDTTHISREIYPPFCQQPSQILFFYSFPTPTALVQFSWPLSYYFSHSSSSPSSHLQGPLLQGLNVLVHIQDLAQVPSIHKMVSRAIFIFSSFLGVWDGAEPHLAMPRA